MSDILQNVLQAIVKERQRQDTKWGIQNHLPQFWTGILGEEYGEFCEAVNETVFDNGTNKGGYDNMYKEAVHVAAVAVGFLEYLERKDGDTNGGESHQRAKCRVCGCTWAHACEGGCYWIEDDLCSKCAVKLGKDNKIC